MKQFFTHFEKWEDYQSGMYSLYSNNTDTLINKSFNLLNNAVYLKKAMVEVIKQWPIATAVNLTNNNANKRAWLGQAACCYAVKSPDYITKIAWNKLNLSAQNKANKAANDVINDWLLDFSLKEIGYVQTEIRF